MSRSVGLMLALVMVLAMGVSRPAGAACPPTESWPPFIDIALDAHRVVIGTVTDSEDGVATQLRVEEILRGDSRRVIDLAMLRARLGPDPGACPFDAAIPARVGDRLAIAFRGQLDGQRGLDSVARLDADEPDSEADDITHLTTPQVRLLLGHEANGSTVALPDREKPPDLLKSLTRALFGDFFDLAGMFGVDTAGE